MENNIFSLAGCGIGARIESMGINQGKFVYD